VAAVVSDQNIAMGNEAMNTLPYRQAFERIHAEFLEMPGMRLTPEQVERLSGVDRAVCKCVLDDLVRAKFLGQLPNGSYGRLSETSKSASRSIHAERQAIPGGGIRRAS
jgi:hypothetical protein